MTRSDQRGQAALEVLALVPLVVLVILLVWQFAVLSRGAILAHERARELTLPASGVVTEVREHVELPSVLPGIGAFRMPVRAEVLAP